MSGSRTGSRNVVAVFFTGIEDRHESELYSGEP